MLLKQAWAKVPMPAHSSRSFFRNRYCSETNVKRWHCFVVGIADRSVNGGAPMKSLKHACGASGEGLPEAARALFKAASTSAKLLALFHALEKME